MCVIYFLMSGCSNVVFGYLSNNEPHLRLVSHTHFNRQKRLYCFNRYRITVQNGISTK